MKREKARERERESERERERDDRKKEERQLRRQKRVSHSNPNAFMTFLSPTKKNKAFLLAEVQNQAA